MRKPIKKICKVCGNEFETTAIRRVTCSDECKEKLNKIAVVEWRKTHKGVDYPEKPCLFCGKNFKPKKIDQTYCCKECRNKDYRKQRKWDHPKKVKTYKVTKNNDSITDIAKLARAAGMTYGQYVADQYKRGKSHG